MANTQRTKMTRNNTAVLLIDHQVGLFSGVRDIDLAELKHNVVALAKAAQVLGLPIVAVTTARDSMWGETIPELKAVLGNMEILDRSTVNAWDEPRFVERVKACRLKCAHRCRRFRAGKKASSRSSRSMRAVPSAITSAKPVSPALARWASK